MKSDFERAKGKHSISAYSSYIAKHPRSEYVPEAERRLEALRFAEAKRVDDLASYAAFVKQYPSSEYLPEATSRIETLRYLEAKRTDNIHAYESFLNEYPVSEHAVDANTRIEELRFEAVREEDTIEGYQAYLPQCSDATRQEHVERRIHELQQNRQHYAHLLHQLTEYSGTRPVGEILESMRHWDPKVRWDAIREYAYAPEGRSVEALAVALLDSNAFVCWESRLALARFAETDERQNLVAFMRRVLSQQPKDDAERFSRHLTLGVLQFILGDDDSRSTDAASRFSAALRLRPNDILTNIMVLSTETRKGELSSAVAMRCLEVLTNYEVDVDTDVTQSNYRGALEKAREYYGYSQLVEIVRIAILGNTLVRLSKGKMNIRNYDSNAFDKVNKGLTAAKAILLAASRKQEQEVKAYYPSMKFSSDEAYDYKERAAQVSEKRKHAAMLLRQYPDGEVAKELRAAYQRETDEVVRDEIMQSLICVKPQQALSLLTSELRQSKNTSVPDSVVQRIGRIGGVEACRALVEKGDRLRGSSFLGIWVEPTSGYRNIASALTAASAHIEDVEFKQEMQRKIDLYLSKSR